jgi:hypothetical protein
MGAHVAGGFEIGVALLFFDPFVKERGLAGTRAELDDVADVEGVFVGGGIWAVIHGESSHGEVVEGSLVWGSVVKSRCLREKCLSTRGSNASSHAHFHYP